MTILSEWVTQKDPELVEFAREEIAELQEKIEKLEQGIKVMLLPR